MTSHRAITILSLLALLLAALGPATAGANSLLSGYGGPGQGNQVILGSALVNGSSSGGGGSGTSGSSSEATGAGALAAATGEQSGSSGSSPRPSSSSSKSSKGARGANRTNAGKSKAPAGAPQKPQTAPVLARADDVGSQALGLSGTDFLYIVVALVALVVTAGLTGRLAAGWRAERGR
jgi:hypothetical protein